SVPRRAACHTAQRVIVSAGKNLSVAGRFQTGEMLASAPPRPTVDYFRNGTPRYVRRSAMLVLRSLLCAFLLGAPRMALMFGTAPQEESELFERARRYQESGDLVNAENTYRRYLRESSSSAQAHANLGVVYAHE